PADEEKVMRFARADRAHEPAASPRDPALTCLEFGLQLFESLGERRHVGAAVNLRLTHEGGALDREHLAGVRDADRLDPDVTVTITVDGRQASQRLPERGQDLSDALFHDPL